MARFSSKFSNFSFNLDASILKISILKITLQYTLSLNQTCILEDSRVSINLNSLFSSQLSFSFWTIKKFPEKSPYQSQLSGNVLSQKSATYKFNTVYNSKLLFNSFLVFILKDNQYETHKEEAIYPSLKGQKGNHLELTLEAQYNMTYTCQFFFGILDAKETSE